MQLINDLNDLLKMNQCSKTEQLVIQYILQHPDKIGHMSSRQLAKATFTSPTTIVRLCQKVGMSGYTEFKLKLLKECNETPNISTIEKQNPITKEDSTLSIVNKLAALEMDAIEETKKALDLDQLERVVSLLNNAQHIDIYAYDNNLHIAKNACAHFMHAGKPASISDGSNAQYMQALTAPSSHISIIISRTGLNENLIGIARILLKKKMKVIVLTESRNSTLANLSTEYIYLYNVHKFSDMGTILFQISAQYVMDLLFSILFSRNYESTMKRYDNYQIINAFRSKYYPYEDNDV